MTSFALRRALPALTGILAVLIGVGLVAVSMAGLPLWLPFLGALVVVGAQYLVTPWLIERVVPAEAVLHDGTRYLTEHPLGEIVARRCHDAGIPLVTLGVVHDGNPNAFTFGHHRKDARVWITTGLLERLDLDEVDAVVAHEIAHVKNNDVMLMAAASAVPLGLYLLYSTLRHGRDEARQVAIAAYIGYLLSQLFVLALSRARESTADHWSCATTGKGDALATALVKVAYGMGEVRAQQREQLVHLRAQGRAGRKATRRFQRDTERRSHAMNVLGIADPRQASATAAIMQTGLPEDRVRGAMRWEIHNPWGRLLEKLSSHPLTARRIDDLAHSGLPGAPVGWGDVTAREESTATPGAGNAFAVDVAVMLAPYLAVLATAAVWNHGPLDRGVGLIAAGVLFFVKQVVRYPSEFVPVDECTSLLTRMDASPMRGIPVSLRGRIDGRGMPGYLLSADLVVHDQSGFLTLLYRQPLPLWGGIFALFKAHRFMGQQVVVRGWYRRGPGPYVEIRDVVAADGTRTRCWEYVLRYAGAVLLVLAGVVALLG